MSQPMLKDSAIVILGESIMDLIPVASGAYQPHVGGSPYNVARALGLQNVPTTYLSPTSSDRFGELLRKQLTADGVALDPGFQVNKPTSLAVVNFDESGAPSYSLYREGIADRDYQFADIIERLPAGLKWLHTGSLAITPADLPRIIEIFTRIKQSGILISVDLNVRPNVVDDHQAYIDGLFSLVPFCDLLKASDEDLRYMGIEDEFAKVAQDLLQTMNGGLVALTEGASGAFLTNGNNTVTCKAYPIDHVEDSVGAGDCFHAGLISGLYREQIQDKQQLMAATGSSLQQCLDWASATAAINVTRKGCNPPTEDETWAFLQSV